MFDAIYLVFIISLPLAVLAIVSRKRLKMRIGEAFLDNTRQNSGF